MQPAVSVIVPVCNVEKHLRTCMDALLAQTLRNMEIIALDDGSTDSSPEILAAYAARDPRVRVIRKPNEGYGRTVNRGIDEARAPYIGIIEPDDYPEPHMYARLLRAAKLHRADLVKCSYYQLFEARGEEPRRPDVDVFPRLRAFSPLEQPLFLTVIPSIWAALYRRDFLNRHGIRCRETPGASFQDTAFTIKAIVAADRIAVVRDALLHYRCDNPDSSSLSTSKVNVAADEYAEARRFLQQYPDRYKALIGALYAKQWGTARWDYRRVAPSCRVQTAARLRSDFMEAARCGDLDLDLFDLHDCEQMATLFEETPEQFVHLNPDTF